MRHLVNVSYRHEPINPGLAEDNIENPFPRLRLLLYRLLFPHPLSVPRNFIRAPRRLLECLYIRGVLEGAVDFRRGKSE